ncbi:uncharacterized protein PV06_07502 [Exophiala oligosperma]|uniref:WW domain-containing protein n=1 Tax=Exophiala oligosperma TaxID=215243 RepID=A0A0D2AJG0_9EURO|nr:uncharacterized protein PV06_07502 [Exophiala oligosperma]KIW40291.1 hypothetical protein PV06_07502 [Exophiala oligosperma]
MSYYNEGYGQSQNYNEPPQVPEPWVARWDGAAGRWYFINQQTGQQTFEYPQQSSRDGGYTSNYRQNYGGQNEGGYYEQQPQKESHTGRNLALGVLGGALAGAFVEHEGEKVGEEFLGASFTIDNDTNKVAEEKWDEDKYRVENDVRQDVDNVEDFPEDAARWTGRKVQDVEDIPQDIENKWDNGVQDVEDVPEDVAGWAGGKIGDAERFGDNVDNAYDQGRDESRYDDDYRGNY